MTRRPLSEVTLTCKMGLDGCQRCIWPGPYRFPVSCCWRRTLQLARVHDTLQVSRGYTTSARLPLVQAVLKNVGVCKQCSCEDCGQVLEGMMEGIKGEVESLTRQLQGVRTELAPGESEAQRCQSAISVATSEHDLLLKRGKDAARKLQVSCICMASQSSGMHFFESVCLLADCC